MVSELAGSTDGVAVSGAMVTLGATLALGAFRKGFQRGLAAGMGSKWGAASDQAAPQARETAPTP